MQSLVLLTVLVLAGRCGSSVLTCFYGCPEPFLFFTWCHGLFVLYTFVASFLLFCGSKGNLSEAALCHSEEKLLEVTVSTFK